MSNESINKVILELLSKPNIEVVFKEKSNTSTHKIILTKDQFLAIDFNTILTNCN